MPLPQGFCVPQGEEIDRMRRITERPGVGTTLLALVSCGEGADPRRLLVINIPPGFAERHITLAEALADPTFANPPAAGPPARTTMSRSNGEKVEVETGIQGRGHDDMCGYFGGTFRSMGLVSTTAGCATVQNKRAISIMFTEPGEDPAQLSKLTARARAVAASIRPARP